MNLQAAKTPYSLFTNILKRKKVIYLIVAANIVGSYFGFFVFYSDQLAKESSWLIPFIPDSPLATFLTAVSLTLYTFNKNNALIDLAAFFANIKYGLWTCIMMLTYLEGFGQMNPQFMNIFIFFSHLGMAIQSLLIWKYLDFGWVSLVPVSGYFFANDIIDYLYGVHPPLPVPQELFGFSSLVELSLTSMILLKLFLGKIKRNQVPDFLERD